MPALTLPPTFSNSFWSQEYRRGLETLYDKLEQGVAENLEIYNFIKARALAENDIGNTLISASPTGHIGKGFDADDGATLLLAFRALQAESVKQGEAHKNVAQELVSVVSDPFGQWASGHANRVHESRKALIDGWLKAYELARGDVETLKQTYLNKTRRADEAEDDAKFAPGTKVSDPYTTSPRMSPIDRTAKRTASVSERISARFKELRKNLADREKHQDDEKKPLSPNSPVFSAGGESANAEDDAPTIPSKDKGKGKEIVPTESPQPMSPPALSPPLPEPEISKPSLTVNKPGSPLPPPPIVLAGLALPAQAVSQLMIRAQSELPLRSVRFPILGEYPDCFTGEELVTWLKDNVEGFGGSLDRAEDAAIDLTERDGALRRIGELGNRFENSKDAFFQFRPKAFEYHFSADEPIEGALSPVAENLMKRTSNFVSIVQKAVAAGTAANAEPLYIRSRREAEEADRIYRVAVRKLDRQRLGLEEKIEETLKTLQRWEAERLRAAKTALLQYHGVISNLPNAFSTSNERSSIAISSYQPESDLVALIERYRTGPFRPTPHIYESITHDKPDIVFGIDLRTWAGEGGWNAVRANDEQKEIEKQDLVPRVVTDLLKGLDEAYKKLPNDSERRKTWIYEVPLPAVHHLREAINTLPTNAPIPADLLAKYDAPVVASTLKLWILELDPPIGLWEGWDDVRKLYPHLGSAGSAEVPEQDKLEDLQTALVKLPKIHLLVLDAIVGHLRNLIDTTQTDESNDVYVTKLAISLGRAVLRPKHETEMSIQDRHPTLLFMDLVNNYAAIIPKVITRKKRESMERPMPTRKRTKMVDQRLSRSKISYEVDPRQLLAAQHAALNPPSRSTSPAPGGDRRRSVSQQNAPSTPMTAATQEEPKDIHVPVPARPSSPPAAAPAPVEPTPEPTPPAEATPSPKPADSYVPPPRPAFAEEDSYVPPPMPTFVEPPPERPETPSKNVVVQPPTPVKPLSPTSSAGSKTPSPTTPTKAEEDKPLVAKSSLSRSGSSDASRVRGPRGARGPLRTSQGGSVSSGLASPTAPRSPRTSPGPRGTGSHSRASSSVALTPEQAAQYAPKRHGAKGSAAMFSRRTVASDAEDNILDK